MMNAKQQIAAALSGVCEGTNGRITARIRFPRDFLGFRGHFPDMPVVPGVCLIQTVVALVEAVRRCSYRLEAVPWAKFFSVVRPEEDVTVECEMSSREGAITRSRALFRAGERKVADLCVHLTVADEKSGSHGAA